MGIVAALAEATGRPARSKVVAAEIGRPWSTTQYWLRMAEASGCIRRVGKRKGYLPVVGTQNRMDALDRHLMQAIASHFNEHGRGIASKVLSGQCWWTQRFIQARLRRLAKLGMVFRGRDKRDGWYPKQDAIAEIVKAVRLLKRNTGRPAQTQALALRVNRPERTTLYLLNKAVSLGLIVRVGKRGGYVPATVAG